MHVLCVPSVNAHDSACMPLTDCPCVLAFAWCAQVAAGKMPEYHCYDLVLLQDISNKLQRLGHEPLAGECCAGRYTGCLEGHRSVCRLACYAVFESVVMMCAAGGLPSSLSLQIVRQSHVFFFA